MFSTLSKKQETKRLLGIPFGPHKTIASDAQSKIQTKTPNLFA